jgi:hypothetical protein
MNPRRCHNAATNTLSQHTQHTHTHHELFTARHHCMLLWAEARATLDPKPCPDYCMLPDVLLAPPSPCHACCCTLLCCAQHFVVWFHPNTHIHQLKFGATCTTSCTCSALLYQCTQTPCSACNIRQHPAASKAGSSSTSTHKHTRCTSRCHYTSQTLASLPLSHPRPTPTPPSRQLNCIKFTDSTSNLFTAASAICPHSTWAPAQP